MTMKYMLLVLFFSCSIVAASDFDPKNWEEVADSDFRDHGSKEKWNEINTGNYVFIGNKSCMACPGGIKVYVVKNKVVRVEGISLIGEGKKLPNEFGFTINELEDEIQKSYKRNPNYIKVEYNRSLGFPEEYYVDEVYGALDDEVFVKIYRLAFIKEKS